jgi:hypothetical protein
LIFENEGLTVDYVKIREFIDVVRVEKVNDGSIVKVSK